MPQDALDDLRAVEFASAPNGFRSRVCLEPLCEVGFGKFPGSQGEKRCRCVDLGRSHPHAIQLREQERRDQRNPLVAIMKILHYQAILESGREIPKRHPRQLLNLSNRMCHSCFHTRKEIRHSLFQVLDLGISACSLKRDGE